jgi:glycosyltransferase involved in cell wall biosynthesis
MKNKKNQSKLVLLIDSLVVGGAERLVVAMAIGLKMQGWNVCVCTTREPGPLGNDLVSAGVELFSANRKHRFDVSGYWVLLKLMLKMKPDVVHAHLPTSNILAILLGRCLGIPKVIVHEHTSPTYGGWLLKFARRLLYPLATSIIVCDSVSAKQMKGNVCAIACSKVRVIPNGVEDDEGVINDDELKAFRRGLLGNACTIVTTIGRLCVEKNHKMFIEAAAILHKRRPCVRFLIVGDGPLREMLTRRIDDLGLLGVVQILGMRSDTRRILRASDVFVLTSVREALPLSIIEAMCAGCAIVSTNVGGISDAIQDNITGVLVDSQNTQQLVAAINALLENDVLRRGLGERARDAYRRGYSMRTMISNLNRVYNQ